MCRDWDSHNLPLNTDSSQSSLEEAAKCHEEGFPAHRNKDVEMLQDLLQRGIQRIFSNTSIFK